MKKNMGSADKIIRIIIAAVIAGLYFSNIIQGTLDIILLVLASFISFYPLYTLLGIKTSKKEKTTKNVF